MEGGEKLGEKLRENKIIFWTEVKRWRNGESAKQESVRDEDGRIITEENEVYEG